MPRSEHYRTCSDRQASLFGERAPERRTWTPLYTRDRSRHEGGGQRVSVAIAPDGMLVVRAGKRSVSLYRDEWPHIRTAIAAAEETDP